MGYYRRKPLETPHTNARFPTRGLISQNTVAVSGEDASNPRPLPRATPLPPDDNPPTAPEASAPEPFSLIGAAAAILEEELAAGMLAAQSVAPYPLSPDLRTVGYSPLGQGSENLMPSLKMLMTAFDSLSAATATARPLPLGLIPGAPLPNAPTTSEATPFLRPRSHVSPGQTATVGFTLVNDSPQETPVSLQSVDLTGPSGNRIAASCIRFSPPESTLRPGAKTPCRIEIRVPSETKPGTYSGTVSSNALPYLRAVLSVDVE